jgi:hypothetical protein
VNGLIWFWPGVTVAIVMGWLLAPAVARALRTRGWIAWLLVLGVGLVVAATLTPIHAPGGIDLGAARPCDLSRRWFASEADLVAMSGVSLHVGAFLPLGVALGLLPRRRRSIVVMAVAVSLAPAIEGLQFVIPQLARACQSGDAIDGLTGLAIGLAAGTVARLAVWAVAGGRRIATR